MPLIRSSQEVYNYLKVKSGETGEPMSILLDRWMSKDIEPKPQSKPSPRPEHKAIRKPKRQHKPKAKAKPKVEVKPKAVLKLKPKSEQNKTITYDELFDERGFCKRCPNNSFNALSKTEATHHAQAKHHLTMS